jgi:hypothetical protein
MWHFSAGSLDSTQTCQMRSVVMRMSLSWCNCCWSLQHHAFSRRYISRLPHLSMIAPSTLSIAAIVLFIGHHLTVAFIPRHFILMHSTRVFMSDPVPVDDPALVPPLPDPAPGVPGIPSPVPMPQVPAAPARTPNVPDPVPVDDPSFVPPLPEPAPGIPDIPSPVPMPRVPAPTTPVPAPGPEVVPPPAVTPKRGPTTMHVVLDRNQWIMTTVRVVFKRMIHEQWARTKQVLSLAS